jgi:glycosyltransferase involved in cell wall biosynthesis
MAEPSPAPAAPLVSVVVPAYNYGHFLADTLRSLREQTLAAWECIVVDDGSTDGTPALVRAAAAADPRVRYVRQENRGLAGARNAGLALARAPFLQYLDADDWLEAGKLERQVAHLRAHPELGLVYGDCRYFTRLGADGRPESGPDDRIPWIPRGDPEVGVPDLLRGIFPPHAPLLARAAAERVGPFEKRFNPNEDWHYWMRCALAGVRMAYREEPGTAALYRQHATSMIANRRNLFRGLRRLRREFARMLRDPADRALNRRLLAEDAGASAIAERENGAPLGCVLHSLRAAALASGPRARLKWVYAAAAAPFTRPEAFRGLVYGPAAGGLGALLRGRPDGR